MPHRVLITGGAGFIGSHLARHLVQQGCHIIVLDRMTYSGQGATLADLIDHSQFSLLRVDLCDFAALRQAVCDAQPDAVCHLAAETHVDRSIDDPSAFVQSNIVGTFQLLECLRDYWRPLPPRRRDAFRLVHMSTDEVYGSVDAGAAFHEASRYDPRSPYSASKAASDHLVRAWWHTYGFPVLVACASNHFGPYQLPEKLIPLVIVRGLRGESIPIYGDGQHVRDWIYVEDGCRALTAILQKGVPGETYHVGGDAPSSNLEVVSILCGCLDRLVPRRDGRSYRDQIQFVADRPGHDRRYAMDTRKIQAELGWCPPRNLQQRLEETVSWYVQHVSWWEPLVREGGLLRRRGAAKLNHPSETPHP